MIRTPWWFCCGWWSPWCLLDTIAHNCGLSLGGDHWICRKHDAAATADLTKGTR